MRGWPDFVLVGAPKSATGTIYELLALQPAVFLAPKDLHFFAPDLATTQPPLSSSEYAAQFKSASADARLGEGSVGYLCSEHAAHAIRDRRPDARIVMALRNPLEAIPSLHQHCLYYGIEEIEDLHAALEAEPHRAEGQQLPRRCAHPWMLRYTHVYSYVAQVERYFDAFGYQQCHVVVYDDLRADPQTVMSALSAFLGLAQPESTPETRINPSRQARSRRLSALLTDPPQPVRRLARGLTSQALRRRIADGVLAANTGGSERATVDPAVRVALATNFADEVDRLSGILNRDLTHWLEASH